MATETPNLVWASIMGHTASNSSTAFVWTNPQLQPGNPPAVTMPAGYVLRANVLTMGSASTVYPITTLVNAGSDAFQLVSGTMSDLRVGMPVIPAVQAVPPNGLPNGLAIVGVNEPTSGSIQLGGGASPWLSGSGEAPWIYEQPTSQTLEAALSAVDEYPYGSLAATVTPNTGVTLVDYGFDGTGNDNNVGDGSSMCNSCGQAMGDLAVTFADAGAYTLAIVYTSTDADYANCSGSVSVTVT
jgi:hypothetical protein